MNDNPESQQGDSAERGESPRSERMPNFFSRWMELLLQLGLGESTLRLATNTLLLVAVAAVIFLMQGFYKDVPNEGEEGAQVEEVAPVIVTDIDSETLSGSRSRSSRGISRMAEIHTTIPTRPRVDITSYLVQEGDTIFGIAEQFGLTAQTILWGNYNTLLDDPHRLKAGQDLNILPVNGTYYEWQDGDGLNGVADFFSVAVDDIVDYPANRLSKGTVGDYANPNIAPGTWLIVPGGERLFISWSAPIGITRDQPASSYLGEGSCPPVTGGAVGYGTFVWPSANHYLSGFDWSPQTNHRGIDIAGQTGAGIFAADAGVIVYAGWNEYGYGNVIIIDHGTGFQSLYAHLSAIYVGCGQSVGQGEAIGAFGSTGNSSGSHLHFELMTSLYGKVNPWDFLPPP